MLELARGRRWLRPFAVGDALVAIIAWAGAIWLRVSVPLPFTRDLLPPDRASLADPAIIVVVLLQLTSLYLLGLYDSPEPLPRLQLASRLARAGAIQLLVLTAALFLLDAFFPRSVLASYLVVDLPLLFLWRSALSRAVTPSRRRALIVGNGPEAAELAAEIAAHHWHGLEVVGFVPLDDQPEEPFGRQLGPRLGRFDDLSALLRDDVCDEIIVAPPSDGWQNRLVSMLGSNGRPSRPDLLLLPGAYESTFGRMRYRWVNDIPLIQASPSDGSLLDEILKRTFDLAGGAVLLLVASPALLTAAVAVKLTSSGPVIYRQTRVGRRERPFTLFKLRTMTVDAEIAGLEVKAVENDPRVTPVGAWLRRFRIDELPQLLNVIAGSMSLVGPRPERPGFVNQYQREVPGYSERFSVAPGLTGLAQVNGDYHSTASNKLRYDLAYIANRSLWLDISILVRTARIVLTSSGV